MRYLTAILFFLLLCSTASANDLDVVKGFFGSDGIENKSEFYTGEMLERFADKPTFGETLASDVTRKYRVIERRKDRIIYAVYMSDGDRENDFYAYLVPEQGKWELKAVRALYIPALAYQLISKMGENTPE
jgi:hypothetical protein